MIEMLCDLLQQYLGWKVPAAFAYTSTRMILAALTSLLFCIGLGSRFILKLYALKIGQTVRSEDYGLIGKLHEKKQDTPTMGGLLMLCSMVVSLFLWMDLTHPFTLLLLITTLLLGGVGAYDDYLKIKHRNSKGLAGRKKLFAQLAISGMLAAYLFIPAVSDALHIGQWFEAPAIREIYESEGFSHYEELSLYDYARRLYVPFFKDPVILFSGVGVLLAVALTFFVIAGSSNAVNLTDGLDGLAAGILLLVAATLGLFAFAANHIELAGYLNILYIEGSGEIAVYLCSFSGACLGFLWYNGHPAQVFMGDVGSLSLGGILGVVAVLLKRELLLALVGGVFVAEALSVILQVSSYRYRNKKRIFLCAPLHHHFEYKGWPETKVVIRFWIVGLILALIGAVSIKFQ